jgi:hypothetical protein
MPRGSRAAGGRGAPGGVDSLAQRVLAPIVGKKDNGVFSMAYFFLSEYQKLCYGDIDQPFG